MASPLPRTSIPALVVLGLWLIAGVAEAQSVEIHVDRTRIQEGDSLQLEIRLEGNIDAIRGPSLEDWEVVSTSNSMRTSIVNGDVRKIRVIRKTLEPQRIGTLNIGPTQALRNERVVANAPAHSIEVEAPPPVQPRSANEASSLSTHRGEDAFILARPSTATPWEGQPFLLTFELYIAQNLPVSNERSDFPELNGFVVTNTLPKNQTVQRTSRLGQKRYTVYTVKRDILVPLKTGRVVVEPLELHLVLGSMFQRKKVRVASQPFVLNVRLLPTTDRPPGFRAGNVGEFRLKVRLDKDTGKAGERRVITVSVEGKGNLKALHPPAFPAVPGLTIERLDTVDTSHVREDEKGMHGSLTYSYLATPTRAGVHTLPPLTLAYFDPVANVYRETSSPPMKLEAIGDLIRTRLSRPIDTSGLKPLAESLGTPTAPRDSRAPSPTYWACLGFLMLTVVAFESTRSWRAMREATANTRRSENALDRATASLKEAMKLGQAGEEIGCHQAIGSALDIWILDRHDIHARGLTHAALREALLARGHSAETAEGVIDTLQNCDRARYAPGEQSPESVSPLVESTRTLLARMQDESKGGRT